MSTFQVWRSNLNKNMADQETLITEINTKKFITKLSDTVELKTDFMQIKLNYSTFKIIGFILPTTR